MLGTGVWRSCLAGRLAGRAHYRKPCTHTEPLSLSAATHIVSQERWGAEHDAFKAHPVRSAQRGQWCDAFFLYFLFAWRPRHVQRSCLCASS
eukprot:6179212-Pleurochrysis_carterae.AAC.2